MDTGRLVDLISDSCEELLPIAGFILLIFAIILCYHLIKLAKESIVQVKKLDRPLEAVGALSSTVEDINDAANKAVKSSLSVVNTKLDDVKEKMAAKKQAKQNKAAVVEIAEQPTNETE